MKTKDEIRTESLNIIRNYNRCSAALSVGVGKTLLGLTHMNEQRSDFTKFLVVASKKAIFKEWKSEAIKFNLEHLIPQIRFSTYLSLHKQDYDVDYVYFDEVHNLKYSHESWLKNYSGNILGLTGTKPKSTFSEHFKMVEKYCPVVCDYLTDDAIEDQILNDYRIIVHSVTLDQRKNVRMEKKGKVWYSSEESIYNYWTNQLLKPDANRAQIQIFRIMRMKCLMDFRSKEAVLDQVLNNSDPNLKTLIFANTKIQAARLSEHSYYTGNKDSEENLEKFKKGEIKELSCVLQLSEGINIPGLNQLFILHSYGKGSSKLPQRIGRGLRLNPEELCTVHLFCYKNTVDEQWVKESLSQFDQSKITYL